MQNLNPDDHTLDNRQSDAGQTDRRLLEETIFEWVGVGFKIARRNKDNPENWPEHAVELVERADTEQERFVRAAHERRKQIKLLYTCPEGCIHLSVVYESFTENEIIKVKRRSYSISKPKGRVRDDEFFSDVLKRIAQGVIILDADLSISYANYRAIELLLPESEKGVCLTGKIGDYLSPGRNWSDLIEWHIERVTGGSLDTDTFIIEDKTDQRTVKATFITQNSAFGSSIVVLLSDISIEFDRIAELNRAKQVIDSVNDSVIHIDSGLRIIDFNAGASTTLGLWNGQTGSYITEHLRLRTADGMNLIDLTEQAAKLGLWFGEAVVIIPEVFNLHVFARVTCNRDEYSNPVGYTLVITDMDRTVRDSYMMGALSDFSRRLSSYDLKESSINSIVADLKWIFGLKHACILLSSDPEQRTARVYPDTIPLFENIQNIELLPRIVKDRFSSPDKVLFGKDCEKIYNLLFARDESQLGLPNWIVHLGGTKTDVGLLMLWDTLKSVEPIALDALAIQTIASHMTTFIEKTASFEEVSHRSTSLSSIIDKTATLLVKFDRLGRILLCNSAFSAQFSNKQANNVLLDGVFAPATEMISSGQWRDILAGRTTTISTTLVDTELRERAISWTISPLSHDWAADKPGKFIASGEDVTDVLVAMEELYEAGSMKEVRKVVGTVSHYFNNSLTVLFSILSDFENAFQAEEDKAMLKKVILANDQAVRIHALVKELLSYSGQTLSLRSEFTFDDAAKEVIEALALEFPTVEFKRTLGCARRRINAVKDHITIILTELLRNAAEAAIERHNPVVRITTSYETKSRKAKHTAISGTVFRIIIEDNGRGMSETAIDSAFELFTTTKQPRSNVPRGLGLPKSRSLAGLMNGSIEIASSETGTKVEVRLESVKHREPELEFPPLVSSEKAVQPDVKSTAPSPSTKIMKGESSRLPILEDPIRTAPLIAILDDDPRVLDVMEEYLRKLGLSVAGFTNPEKAKVFLLAERDTISALILDHNLGDITGPDFLAELESRGFNRPVFLCTGYGADINEDDRLNSVIGVISKPFKSEDLRRHLAIFLPQQEFEFEDDGDDA